MDTASLPFTFYTPMLANKCLCKHFAEGLAPFNGCTKVIWQQDRGSVMTLWRNSACFLDRLTLLHWSSGLLVGFDTLKYREDTINHNSNQQKKKKHFHRKVCVLWLYAWKGKSKQRSEPVSEFHLGSVPMLPAQRTFSQKLLGYLLVVHWYSKKAASSPTIKDSSELSWLCCKRIWERTHCSLSIISEIKLSGSAHRCGTPCPLWTAVIDV